MGDYGKSEPAGRRIPPLSAQTSVKAYPAFRQLVAFHRLALILLANVPSPTLNHLAASWFQSVAAFAAARRMESCPAHHRIEEIGGGPYRADPVGLGVAELVGDVDVVDEDGEVDDGPRAGQAY